MNGQKNGIYCNQHKIEGMTNVISKRCIYPECKKQSGYNFDNEVKPIYCAEHKTNGMINVICRTCNNEWCKTNVKNNKYDGYCLRCFMYMFPDKPVSRNYKTKEYAVVEFVKANFPQFTWKDDKRIQGGSSQRRPDLLLDLEYQVIIVEIDENQHITYDCSCENKRIMELSQDVAFRPIVFIRFNPDDYNQCEITVTSCWGIDKRGFCAVKKTKTKEWTNRLTALKTQIEYWTNPENKTNKTIETVELFYDSV